MKHKKIACLISLFLLRGMWLSAMDNWGELAVKALEEVTFEKAEVTFNDAVKAKTRSNDNN